MPLLVPVVTLGCGLIVTGAWWLQHARGEAARELGSLERLEQERDRLAHQTPSLSAENESALAAEVASADRVLAEFRHSLAAIGPAAAAPAGSTEAYFALADFIGDLRARAGQAQVLLKREECFGFASYASTGPVPALVAVVHRQRLDTEYLVTCVLESRPMALLAVRRERPVVAGSVDQRELADDYFALDSPPEGRRPDGVEGLAYQLEFTGPTAVLRDFLNRLAAGRRLVLVRSVQVEPMGATVAPSPPGALAPLVGPVSSKFTVSVECVRWAEDPGKTAP